MRPMPDQVYRRSRDLYPLRRREMNEPGLIVRSKPEVNRIVFAADLTSAMAVMGAATGAISPTHHPLFFRSVHEASGSMVSRRYCPRSIPVRL